VNTQVNTQHCTKRFIATVFERSLQLQKTILFYPEEDNKKSRLNLLFKRLSRICIGKYIVINEFMILIVEKRYICGNKKLVR